jgi:putative ubiquitin-RnfH superfamily antitoxin RatB of RatAB toxin-antitoxin module
LDDISVEVVYAQPGAADTARVRLAAGATVADAIRAAGTLGRHPEIDLSIFKVGIFGSVVSAEHVVRDGERVEIYRPLRLDPKEARRRRALGRR